MYYSGFDIRDRVANNQKKFCPLCKKFYFIAGKMSEAELCNGQPKYFSIIQTLQISYSMKKSINIPAIRKCWRKNCNVT